MYAFIQIYTHTLCLIFTKGHVIYYHNYLLIQYYLYSEMYEEACILQKIPFLKRPNWGLHVFTCICIQSQKTVEWDFPNLQAVLGFHSLCMVWRSTCRDLKPDCQRKSITINIFSLFLLRLPHNCVVMQLKVQTHLKRLPIFVFTWWLKSSRRYDSWLLNSVVVTSYAAAESNEGHTKMHIMSGVMQSVSFSLLKWYCFRLSYCYTFL